MCSAWQEFSAHLPYIHGKNRRESGKDCIMTFAMRMEANVVVVDAKSKWPEVIRMGSTAAEKTNAEGIFSGMACRNSWFRIMALSLLEDLCANIAKTGGLNRYSLHPIILIQTAKPKDLCKHSKMRCIKRFWQIRGRKVRC